MNNVFKDFSNFGQVSFFDSVLDLFLTAIAIFIAIGLHEYVKALASTRLNDTKPKDQGRLTINPLKHTDPLGFLCFFIFGYGWSKPCETSSFSYPNRKNGTLIVYALPLLFNLVLGILLAVINSLFIKFMYLNFDETNNIIFNTVNWFSRFLTLVSTFNISFAVFSLIPVYPLDGAKILSVFVSPNTVVKLARNEKIFQLILVLCILFGVVSTIVNPITFFIISICNFS